MPPLFNRRFSPPIITCQRIGEALAFCESRHVPAAVTKPRSGRAATWPCSTDTSRESRTRIATQNRRDLFRFERIRSDRIAVNGGKARAEGLVCGRDVGVWWSWLIGFVLKCCGRTVMEHDRETCIAVWIGQFWGWKFVAPRAFSSVGFVIQGACYGICILNQIHVNDLVRLKLYASKYCWAFDIINGSFKFVEFHCVIWQCRVERETSTSECYTNAVEMRLADSVGGNKLRQLIR